MNELTRKDLQNKLDKYEAGAEARAPLVSEAAHKRKVWSTAVHELTPKVAALQAQVATLKGNVSPFTALSVYRWLDAADVQYY